jgi:arylsulfatase
MLSAEENTVIATIGNDGKLTLMLNGKQAVSSISPGAFTSQPQDGLQVGRDDNRAVGPYPEGYPFAGRIAKVTLHLE